MIQLKIVRDIMLGIKTLMLHKLRSFLTMLGVVFGVGSVVAMLAVGEGASREALNQIKKLGSNNIIISSIKPLDDEKATTTAVMMSIYGLKYEDERRIREGLPDDVEHIVPAKLIRKEGRLNARAEDLRIVATSPIWFELVPRDMIAGRRLNQQDMDEKKPVCVLTEFGARRLLATENSVGQTIRLGSDVFEVVGIIRSEQADAGGVATPDQAIDVYMPLSVARERFGDMFTLWASGSRIREMVELHQMIVQVKSTDRVEAVAEAIKSMLQRFHKKTDYQINVPLALLRQAEATKRTFNIVLGSIAGISLLVGGIGIMNIMLASVTERTREIGVRRAIGARRRQIIVQFLIETLVLTTVGGVLGIIFGIIVPEVIERFAGMPTVVPIYAIILSLGISAAVGIIFGLYPAIRAANLEPIKALRHE